MQSQDNEIKKITLNFDGAAIARKVAATIEG